MSEDADKVLAQHHDLDYMADRLRLLSHASAEVLDQGRARYVIERELRSLCEFLRAHFQYEERDGYMASVVIDRPHLVGEVEALRADHDTLRQSMEELEATSYEDGPCADLQRDILEFLDLVRRHEQSENTLMMRFMTEEYGRGSR